MPQRLLHEIVSFLKLEIFGVVVVTRWLEPGAGVPTLVHLPPPVGPTVVAASYIHPLMEARLARRFAYRREGDRPGAHRS